MQRSILALALSSLLSAPGVVSAAVMTTTYPYPGPTTGEFEPLTRDDGEFYAGGVFHVSQFDPMLGTLTGVAMDATVLWRNVTATVDFNCPTSALFECLASGVFDVQSLDVFHNSLATSKYLSLSAYYEEAFTYPITDTGTLAFADGSVSTSLNILDPLTTFVGTGTLDFYAVVFGDFYDFFAEDVYGDDWATSTLLNAQWEYRSTMTVTYTYEEVPVSVSEPGSLVLFGAGVMGLLLRRRRGPQRS